MHASSKKVLHLPPLPQTTGQYPNIGDKDIYLIRHAEGFHNIGHDHHIDAHLTAHGWAQTAQLRDYLNTLQPALPIETVYVSPLTRTLETAAGVFGAQKTGGNHFEVLMDEQSMVPGLRVAAGPLYVPNGVQFAALELCRERVGPHPCDGRRQLALLSQRFPAVDFSLASIELRRQCQQFGQLQGIIKQWVAETQHTQPLVKQLQKKLHLDLPTHQSSLGVASIGCCERPTEGPCEGPQQGSSSFHNDAAQHVHVQTNGRVRSPFTTPPSSTSSEASVEPLDAGEHAAGPPEGTQGSVRGPACMDDARADSPTTGMKRLGSDGSLSEWMSGFNAFHNQPQPNSPRSREFGAASFKTGEDLVWQALRNNDNEVGRYSEGESEVAVNARGLQLLQWLTQRSERHLAVVAHCGILHHMFVTWAKECGLSTEEQLALGQDFENCELRVIGIRQAGSVVTVERLFAPSKGAVHETVLG